jgi:hypothetical protein
MKKAAAPLLLILTALLAVQAGATVVTSIPGGTVIPMPVLNYFGPGPQTFSGVTWSSTNASTQGGSVFGYTGGYGFGSNGSWDGSLGPMAGVNDANVIYGVTDTMAFSFATPVMAVGGFINYYPDAITTPTVIAVYDSSLNLIESFTLSFSTGGGTNSGFFFGFQETTPISQFTLTDNYVGITNLTVASVPEPGTLTLIGTGLIGAFGLIRRRMGK